jgi:hypothetical protein
MNMTPEFFFDTADTAVIKTIWSKLQSHCKPEHCIGITTNPNALAKVNCNTLSHFEKLVKDMSTTLEDIRGPGGLVYVQVPQSIMTEKQVLSWVNYISQLDTGTSKIALKIPHFSYILNLTPAMANVYVNVTGISDFGTLLRVMNYPHVHFASIIPGRMEEVGIDANAHLKYIADVRKQPHQRVITGSMRTIEGLKNSIYYRTVPTIGTRVWDLFESQDLWQSFTSYWSSVYETDETPNQDFCPTVTDANINLSRAFFEQMDGLGKSLYNDFVSNDLQN